MKCLLSVVIPCYNEAANLPALFKRVQAALDVFAEAEYILVNNGSKDNTGEILGELVRQAGDSRVVVHTVEVNRGYGFGIMSGLRIARGVYLGWTHADMQCDPLDVVAGAHKLLEAQVPKRALLRGRRMDRGLWDEFFTWGMGVVASLVLGYRMHDVNAQPKLFHRTMLAQMKDAPNDFSLDLYLLWLAHKNGMKFLELPVSFAMRRHGEAKGGGTFKGKIKLIIRTFDYILKLRKNLR